MPRANKRKNNGGGYQKRKFIAKKNAEVTAAAAAAAVAEAEAEASAATSGCSSRKLSEHSEDETAQKDDKFSRKVTESTIHMTTFGSAPNEMPATTAAAAFGAASAFSADDHHSKDYDDGDNDVDRLIICGDLSAAREIEATQRNKYCCIDKACGVESERNISNEKCYSYINSVDCLTNINTNWITSDHHEALQQNSNKLIIQSGVQRYVDTESTNNRTHNQTAAADYDKINRTLEMGNSPSAVRTLVSDDLSDITEATDKKIDLGSAPPSPRPIIKEVIAIHYRVDSPLMTVPASHNNGAVPIQKSRSLDSSDCLIQEVSDGGSSTAGENTALISEVESEQEQDEDAHLDSCRDEEVNDLLVSVQTLPLTSDATKEIQRTMTAEEEEELRIFIQTLDLDSPPVSLSTTSTAVGDVRARRARKRAAIESHFMPQFMSPRYLDAIKEENSSDASDAERTKSVGRTESNTSSIVQCDDLEDDVFYDNDLIMRKASAIFPRTSCELNGRRKHVSNLRAPATDAIREEPPLQLVDTKLVETAAVSEGCTSSWTTSTMRMCSEHETDVELIYVMSSSSSTSDILDVDGEQGDDEHAEEVHRITTPIIGDGEQQLAHDQLMLGYFKIGAPCAFNMFPVSEPNNGDSENKQADNEHDKHVKHDETVAGSAATRTVLVDDVRPQQNENKQNNDDKMCSPLFSGEVATTRVAATAVAVAVAVAQINDQPPDLNSLSSNCDAVGAGASACDYVRQDSGSSVCSISSHSHSNSSHSQSTTRFLSQTDLTVACSLTGSGDTPLDYGSSSCVSGAVSLDLNLAELDVRTMHSLRQLCVDQLAAMPYGDIVLEELATVARNLGQHTGDEQQTSLTPTIQHQTDILTEEMPYPRPPLPHIDRLRVITRGSYSPTLAVVHLVPALFEKVQSPPPPPVPMRPTQEIWTGIPTERDPKLLVCFSPSQIDLLAMKESGMSTLSIGASNADTLLDMHTKFIERRGYHEPEKSAENETNTTAAKDDNDHRLLALIRDLDEPPLTTPASLLSERCSGTSVSVNCAKKIISNSNTNLNQNSLSAMASLQNNNDSHDQKRLPFDFDFDVPTRNSIENLTKRFSSDANTKRFSNIETSSFESKKQVENGKLLFEKSDSSRKKIVDRNGDRTTEQSRESQCDDRRRTKLADDSSAGYRVSGENVQSAKDNFKNSEWPTEASIFTDTPMRPRRAKSEFAFGDLDFATPPPFLSSLHTDFYRMAKEERDKHRSEFFTDLHLLPKCNDNFFAKSQENIRSTPMSASHSDLSADTKIIKHEIKIEQHEANRNRAGATQSEKRLSSVNLSDWLHHATNERDNAQPVATNAQAQPQVLGRRDIRAPRLSESKSTTKCDEKRPEAISSRSPKERQSMIDETPITRHVSVEKRRLSLPREIHEHQLSYIKNKERELKFEFERLEQDRRRLLSEIDKLNECEEKSRFTAAYNGCDRERFQQEMHHEWMDKVAEREERRLHKIIKISKPIVVDDEQKQITSNMNASSLQQRGDGGTQERTNRLTKTDLGDEFLKRVHERRTKLCMPADSDWDSGAESQPVLNKSGGGGGGGGDGGSGCDTIDPEVKIIAGSTEANLTCLPKHLQEFVKFTPKSIAECKEEREARETKRKYATTTATIISTGTGSKSSVADGGELPDATGIFGLLCVFVIICWSVCRSLLTKR